MTRGSHLYISKVLFGVLHAQKHLDPLINILIVFIGISIAPMINVQAQPKKLDIKNPVTEEVDNVIMVKYKAPAAAAMLSNDDTQSSGVASVDMVIDKENKIVETEKIVEPGKNADLSSDLARWSKIEVLNPGSTALDVNRNTYYPDVDDIIAQLKTDPNVEAVVKDQRVKLALTANDPYYNTTGNIRTGQADMWGLNNIRAAQAWDTTQGSTSVVIGIADSGVDISHPDIIDNAWQNNGEIPNNGLDDDNNGYIDDFNGWNFRGNNNNATDVIGHGTHVAGTVAARGNNNIGITGVSWRSKIMPLRICDSDNYCYFNEAVQSIRYAADMGAKVINNSYGGSNAFYPPLRDAIKYAHERNVTIVAAAGNSAVDALATGVYPANDERAINVGASTISNQLAYFSNYGARTDVVAPGLEILSTKSATWLFGASSCPSFFGGTYCQISGTSMAAPHVSGLAALMYSVNPSLTSEQVRQILRKTTLDLGTAGKDTTFGYGLIQADAAVAASVNPTVLAPLITSPTYYNTQSGVFNISGNVIGPNFSSYKIEIGAGFTPSTWTQIVTSTTQPITTSVLASFNSYSLPNGSYTLKLTATNTSNVDYEFSVYVMYINNVTDTTPPTNPTNLAGTPSSGSVQLSWTASTDAGSGLQNYIVRRDGVSVGTPVSNSFTDTGLNPSTTYNYSVQAIDNAGNVSTGSATNSFTTFSDSIPPTAPTNFVAQTRNNRSITLAWTASTDNGVVAGYRIYRTGALVQTTSATSWTDSPLAINTAYSYGIEAFDAAGNTSSRTTLATSTSSDTVPPVISFTSPASGALIIRNSNVVLNASDDEAIQRVEIFRGAVLVRTLTTSPYTTTFNAVSLANGSQNITAVAYDTSNNSAQAVLPVVISNPKRGDVTNDNVINILDLSSLLSGWNSIDLNKDLDGNDLINIFDLSILLYEYGR